MAFCRILVSKMWFLDWGPPNIDSMLIQYLFFIRCFGVSDVVSRTVDSDVGLNRSFDE
jgi:hypothetical protein